jgi:hypothetical protein
MRVDGADLGEMRSALFLPQHLDDPNHVELASEIRALAQRVLAYFWTSDVRPWIEMRTDLPCRAISSGGRAGQTNAGG